MNFLEVRNFQKYEHVRNIAIISYQCEGLNLIYCLNIFTADNVSETTV